MEILIDKGHSTITDEFGRKSTQIYITDFESRYGKSNEYTVYLDVEKLGNIHYLEIGNKVSGAVKIIDAHVTIKPLNGQVTLHTNAKSHSARTALLYGFKSLTIDGGYEGFSTGKMYGGFGFLFSGYTGFKDRFNLMADNIYNLTIKNCEFAYGNMSVRLWGVKNVDFTAESFNVENVFIHDTLDGEGIYAGVTGGTPFQKIKNCKLKNVLFLRTAAEGLQLQHLLEGAEIENVVIKDSGFNAENAFQNYQDSGTQFVTHSDAIFRNSIIDGAGASNIFFLGEALGEKVNSTTFENIYAGGIRGTALYVAKNDGKALFKNIFIGDVPGDFHTYGNSPQPSVLNVNDKNISFENVMYDQPRPKYANDPFGGVRPKLFSETYAYWSVKAGQKIPRKVGEIVAYIGKEYGFYKVIEDNLSENPETSGKYELMLFDGQRMPVTEDLRLLTSCQYAKSGMGLTYQIDDEEEVIEESEPIENNEQNEIIERLMLLFETLSNLMMELKDRLRDLSSPFSKRKL